METARSEHGTLPLAPIESPRSLSMRLVYALTKRRYGVTPTAFRVIYARFPAMALVSAVMITLLDRCLTIGTELRYLLQLSISTRNGCTFCTDLVLAEAVKQELGRERFRDLLDAASSPAFDEKEKAALAYAEAVTASSEIDDAIFARLAASFDERAVVEIVFVCAVEHYFNKLARPLRIGSDGIVASDFGRSPRPEALASPR